VRRHQTNVFDVVFKLSILKKAIGVPPGLAMVSESDASLGKQENACA
jgi:aspartate aminotransferase-like enzyme